MDISFIQRDIRSQISVYNRKEIYIHFQFIIFKNTVSKIIFQCKAFISVSIPVPHILWLHIFCKTSYFSTILRIAKTGLPAFYGRLNIVNKSNILLFKDLVYDLLVRISAFSVVTYLGCFLCSYIRGFMCYMKKTYT